MIDKSTKVALLAIADAIRLTVDTGLEPNQIQDKLDTQKRQIEWLQTEMIEDRTRLEGIIDQLKKPASRSWYISWVDEFGGVHRNGPWSSLEEAKDAPRKYNWQVPSDSKYTIYEHLETDIVVEEFEARGTT